MHEDALLIIKIIVRRRREIGNWFCKLNFIHLRNKFNLRIMTIICIK